MRRFNSPAQGRGYYCREGIVICESRVQVIYAGHPQLALQPRHAFFRMNSTYDILFGIVVLQLDHRLTFYA